MKHSITDRVLALAGVFQAAWLVDQVANTGNANTVFVENSLETLFRFDAGCVEDVYGGVIGVQQGLRTLRDQFTADRDQRSVNITRYVVSLLVLERKLSRKRDMLQLISDNLEVIEGQLEFFNLAHDNMFAKLADVYRNTISTIGPRVMVEGEQPYLSNERNADKVRSLLLAGIRSAVLWRQCGGNRWQILFGRQKYIDECESLLA